MRAALLRLPSYVLAVIPEVYDLLVGNDDIVFDFVAARLDVLGERSKDGSWWQQRAVSSTWFTVPQSGRLRDRLSVCNSALLSLVGLPCRCVSGVLPLRDRLVLKSTLTARHRLEAAM